MDTNESARNSPPNQPHTTHDDATDPTSTPAPRNASLDVPFRDRGTSRHYRPTGHGLPTWEQLSPRAQDAVIANRKLAARLTALGSNKYAKHLRDCMTSAAAWCCRECGCTTWHVNHCRQRLCAACSEQYAWDRARIGRAITRRMTAPKFLTLTMRREPDLRRGITRLRKAIVRFRHLNFIKTRIKGGFYVIEVKPKPGGWHIHAHMIIDAPYLPQRTLSHCWARCLKQDYGITDIRRINSAKVARYVVKYCSKPTRLEHWTDAQLIEYVDAMHNTRVLSKFGAYYGMKLSECERHTDAAQLTCPACGTSGAMFPAIGASRIIGNAWRLWLAHAIGRSPPIVPIDMSLYDATPQPETVTAS